MIGIGIKVFERTNSGAHEIVRSTNLPPFQWAALAASEERFVLLAATMSSLTALEYRCTEKAEIMREQNQNTVVDIALFAI